MPKYDEPITMEKYVARREEEDAILIKANLGPRSGRREFRFNNDDKEHIRSTMPCGDNDADDWINSLETGIVPYRAWRKTSVADIRKRLKLLAVASKALDHDMLRLLETAYNPRSSDALRTYWREANIAHAVTLMSAAAQDALPAVQTNKRRDANIGIERLANLIARLWVKFSGRNAENKLEGIDGHISAILNCLKKIDRPSEDYFIKRVREIVTLCKHFTAA